MTDKYAIIQAYEGEKSDREIKWVVSPATL